MEESIKSSFKKKIYICIECGKETLIRSKKKCSFCRSKDLPKKHYDYNIKVSEKQRQKKKVKSELMKPYWDYHLQALSKGINCQNCGERLQPSIISIAHILPKRLHTEVMDELLNCIYLCAFCHQKFDRIQSTPQVYLMPCFKVAFEKYLSFKHKIKKWNKYVSIFENWDSETKKCSCGHDKIDHITLNYSCEQCECDEYTMIDKNNKFVI